MGCNCNYNCRCSTVASVQGSDKVNIISNANGDCREASFTTILAYMQANLTFTGSGYTTQYAAPAASGFNVQITDGSNDIHLILTPIAGYAAGTITLPAVGNLIDKQRVLVNTTKAVTTLTIAANGASAVIGGPGTLAANDYFTLKYDAGLKTWYRVG